MKKFIARCRRSSVARTVLISGILSLSVAVFSVSKAADTSSVAGSYGCWKYNIGINTITQVGQQFAKCTSPDLILKSNGTYTLGSEKGKFKVTAKQVSLSASKFRGSGTLSEQDTQINFEYEYKNKHHSVTYLKRGDNKADPISAPSVGTNIIIPVDLILVFPDGDKSVTWMNTATLMDGDKFGAEALAVLDGKSKLKVYFRQVRIGKIYTIYVSSGFDKIPVGKLDLLRATGRVNRTIKVHTEETNAEIDKSASSLAPRSPSTRPSPVGSEPVNSPSSRALPKCDPLIPRYSQPECDE